MCRRGQEYLDAMSDLNLRGCVPCRPQSCVFEQLGAQSVRGCHVLASGCVEGSLPLSTAGAWQCVVVVRSQMGHGSRRPQPALATYSRTLTDDEHASGCLCPQMGLCVESISALRPPEIPTCYLKKGGGPKCRESTPQGTGLHPGRVRTSPPGRASLFVCLFVCLVHSIPVVCGGRRLSSSKGMSE